MSESTRQYAPVSTPSQEFYAEATCREPIVRQGSAMLSLSAICKTGTLGPSSSGAWQCVPGDGARCVPRSATWKWG
jgi:hypothetical protein